VKQVTGISTTDTGLQESTTYSYNVTAIDNASNESGMSNTAVTNTPTCQVCGNGIVETGEECDDGNNIDGDGCSATCTIEAGSSNSWSWGFGDTDNDIGYSVAVDDSGNVVMTGDFKGTVDFGGGPLSSVDHPTLGRFKDVFLAKYSETGEHLWSRRFGDKYDDTGLAVTVDGDGNVVVAGKRKSIQIDFGGGPEFGFGGEDIFIAKYWPNGDYIWSKTIGGSGTDSAYGVAVDGVGNILVTGEFQQSVDFGGTVLTSTGSRDIFVAKYSASGVLDWAKSFGGTTGDSGRGVAADALGNVFITGYFYNTVNFGGGSLTSAGSGDIFVAKFSASGAHEWSKRFGGTNVDYGNAIAVDGNNEIIITGSFKGTVDFGGGAFSSLSDDIFVAKYSGFGGYQWSEHYRAPWYQFGSAIAVNGNSNIAVTGKFENTVDFGNGPHTSNGDYDIFLFTTEP
jgi:cysteine-rich repeat protein